MAGVRRTRPHTTGESSPGPAAPGAQPSRGMWQMPQTSSSVVQVHEATACQFLMVHFMPGCNLATGGSLHRRRRSAAPLFPAGTEVILCDNTEVLQVLRTWYLCDNGISYMSCTTSPSSETFPTRSIPHVAHCRVEMAPWHSVPGMGFQEH